MGKTHIITNYGTKIIIIYIQIGGGKNMRNFSTKKQNNMFFRILYIALSSKKRII